MEILHTFERITEAADAFIVAGALFGAVALVVSVVAFTPLPERNILVGTISLVVVAIAVLSIVIGHLGYERDTYHDVIITDMSEFDHDRYEIVAQNGRIFTVKEDD